MFLNGSTYPVTSSELGSSRRAISHFISFSLSNTSSSRHHFLIVWIANMAAIKPSEAEKDISHIEHHSSSPTHPVTASIEDEEIKGRDFTVEDNELPAGYFKSFSFIGSMFAIGLSFSCGVGGFTLPAPVLGFINADIGPDANITWVALAYLLTTSIGLIIGEYHPRTRWIGHS